MLKINTIDYKGIFEPEFTNMQKNNVIKFNQKIAVAYAPNGTGKSSFVNAMKGNDGSVDFVYEDINYASGEDIFQIIDDQNKRNIISGETQDFILGDNIRKEKELLDKIKNNKEKISTEFSAILKELKIKSMKSEILRYIDEENKHKIISDHVNSKSKGYKITDEELIEYLKTSEIFPIELNDKHNYIIDNIDNKNSLLQMLMNLENEMITKQPNIKEYEKNCDALTILNKYKIHTCIVCDSENINRDYLLKNKQDNNENILHKCDKQIQVILKEINMISGEDPFNIKNLFLEALENANENIIFDINNDIKNIINEIIIYIVNNLQEFYRDSNLQSLISEYRNIIDEKVCISDEDYNYIKRIMNDAMDKKLELKRVGKELILKIDNDNLIGVDRDKLPLSNGEQNFLSITLELLKAKNSDKKIILIDDPISSFDSVFKNKVVFAMIEVSKYKNIMVLSHNMDLIRLLNAQYKNSYELYLLNNSSTADNGFIKVKNKERDILISSVKLLDLLRGEIFSNIIDREYFLLSLIPFMRGYANIINNNKLYNDLTNLMHGYKNIRIDLAEIYNELFLYGNKSKDEYKGKKFSSYVTSVGEILELDRCDNDIIDPDKYYLLNRTLKHTYTYLYLRLSIEKILCNKYNIDTSKDKILGEIIAISFPVESLELADYRIRLNTKKTLVNEFNHFESDFNIFQPAIDITDKILNDEFDDIMKFLEEIK